MARRSYTGLLITLGIIPLAVWLRTGRLQSPLTFSPSPSPSSSSSCRCFPGDACWPSPEEWSALNDSLSGNLLTIDPIGSVCHTNTASYDNEKCATLQKQWSKPSTHYDTPSPPMAAWWTNSSCSPFSGPDSPCTIGPLARYAANVTSIADVQHVLRFVQAKNIRLVIRNTGHEYMGKSTGAGALALWTHHLKFIETVLNYTSRSYTGPAKRIGSGVQGFEAQNAAHEAGYVVVTGHCPDACLGVCLVCIVVCCHEESSDSAFARAQMV